MPSLKRPGRLWGPPIWSTRFFSWAYSGRSVKLTTHFCLMPRLEWSCISAPPTCMACTGPTLFLRFARGAKILGTRSPSRLNFVRWSLNTSGSSVWKLYHVTVLARIIYETVSRIGANCGSLPLTITGHLPRYAAARVDDRLLLQSRGRRGAPTDSLSDTLWTPGNMVTAVDWSN